MALGSWTDLVDGVSEISVAPINSLGNNLVELENVVENLEIPQAGNPSPAMDGNADAGVSTSFSRSDHVHPSDTSKASADNFYVEAGAASYTSVDYSTDAAQVTQVTITDSDFFDTGSYHALTGGGNFTTSQGFEITTSYQDAVIMQMHSLSTVDGVSLYYHVTLQSEAVTFYAYYGGVKSDVTGETAPPITIHAGEWVKVYRQNGEWYVHGVQGAGRITMSDGTHKAQLPELSSDKTFGSAAFTEASAYASASSLTWKADKAIPTAANNIALLDANGNLLDSELQTSDIGGGGGMTSDITVLSGTSLSLENGKVYKLVPSGNTTFTLPTVTDTTKTHQIEIYLSADTVYTYTFPQGCLYVGALAPYITTGVYRLIFEYEPTAGAWCIGCVAYGAVS